MAVVCAGQTASADTHPSLFFETGDLPDIKARAESLPWMRDVKSEILNAAERYMGTSTTPYPLSGPDNGMGTAGRALQNRLGTLGFAAMLTDEPRYGEKGREILLAVVRQTEPDNKAHWRGHLQQADATQAIAMGYDWLYSALTDEERKEVKDELRRFGQVLWDTDTTWGADAPGVLSCNHNSVQFGALGLAALVLGDQPEWLEFSTLRVQGYFNGFADATGYATEGTHYLGYGLGGAVPFAMALKQAGGPDLMANATTLPFTGDQPLWKILPFEGRMVALNDNDERPAEIPGLVGPLRAGNGAQLWAVLESLRASGSMHELGGYFGITYTSPFLFLWGDQPTAPVHPKNAGLPHGHKFESGRVFLRSSWEGEDAAHVSLTSGYDFHRGHDHQDENSVTFFSNGEGFLIDPQYWLETSDAHTTLTIKGVEQIKGGDGRIVTYREDGSGSYVHGQAEEAYDFQKAFIGQADRQLYFSRGDQPYIFFRDDLRLESDKSATFVSRYITYPENQIKRSGKGVIIKGYRGNASALMVAFSGTKQVTLKEDDVSETVLNRRNKDYKYSDYLRRIVTEFDAVSPELTTFVIPFEGNRKPRVSIGKGDSRGEFVATVNLPDGTEDRFRIGRTDIRPLDSERP
jgi:hypothetical protein